MGIEFIKDVCSKAGFKITKDSDGEEYIYYTDDRWIAIEYLYDDPVFWPFTLQRAIEGVNKIWIYELQVHRSWIGVYEDGQISKEFYFNPCIQNEIDLAKESALKFIYEQEKK